MRLDTLIESLQELKKGLESRRRGLESETPDLKTTQLEKRIERLEEELRAASRTYLVGQLLRRVLHEVKNHLGTINTASYYLKSKLGNAETAGGGSNLVKFVDIIGQEVNRADALLDKISAFARSPQLVPEAVRVEEVLTEAFRLLEKERPVPETVKIVKRIVPGFPRLRGDRRQLARMLTEILLNAVEAMPAGGKLMVDARVQRPEDGNRRESRAKPREKQKAEKEKPEIIEISVQDTGKGIAEENREKLLDPLFTTKTKGYGLGLPVAADIISKHGGELKIDTESGRGTRVRVCLPDDSSRTG